MIRVDRVLAVAIICGATLAAGALAAPRTAKGDPRAGEVAFKKATCVVCHPGGENRLNSRARLKGPDFAREFADDAKIVELVRKGSPRRGMPAFDRSKLSDRELADIIAYIRTLTPPPGR